MTQHGRLRWKFATGGAVVSSPAIDYSINNTDDGNNRNEHNDKVNVGARGTIYVGSGDTELYAISLSGRLKWSFKTGGAIISSPAIGTGGVVYVGSNDGYLYAVNRGGGLVWSFPVSSKCSLDASPAVGPKGTVYVGVGRCSDGFYAINRDGTVLWRYRLPEIRSSAAIGADGTIYVGVDDPVYAFNPDGTVKWASGFISNNPQFIFYSSPSIAPDGTIYIGTEYHGTLLAIS